MSLAQRFGVWEVMEGSQPDMREPVSNHHVYHKALMYDIGVGGIMLDRFFMSDIDLLIIHKV